MSRDVSRQIALWPIPSAVALRLGFQPGKLAQERKHAIGLEFESYNQRLFSPCRNFPLALLYARDDDIPEYVAAGIAKKSPGCCFQKFPAVIAVRDIVYAMDRISKAGGRLLGEPMQIPGVGGYVSFMDTEGNRVSLLQPLPMPRATATKRAVAKKKRPAATKKKRPAATKKKRPAAKKKRGR